MFLEMLPEGFISAPVQLRVVSEMLLLVAYKNPSNL
jgi:hypothetical protein